MKTLVLDANILIRAVLGQRVRQLLIDHAPHVNFFAADTAFDEARRHLPTILSRRRVPESPGLAMLAQLPTLVCALLLDCPIWSEDADFFGTGVATWTTSRIGLFLCDSL